MRTVHLFRRSNESAAKDGTTFDYKAESACKVVSFTYEDTRSGDGATPRAVECFAVHNATNTCKPCVSSHVEAEHRFPALIA